MRFSFASLLVAFGASVSVAWSADAGAQSAAPVITPPPTSSEPVPTTTQTEWYGWQTLLVDAAAIGTLFANGTAGGLVYGFGPPLVHALHGRPGPMIGDVFLRIGAPILLGAIGYAIDVSSSSPCHSSSQDSGFDFCFRGLGGLVVGAFVGYLTAVVLDAAVLAREPVVKRPSDVARYKLRWTPTVGATPRGGVTAGLSAIF